ncbi:aryl-sulfate sulfotransferase [bacterium]
MFILLIFLTFMGGSIASFPMADKHQSSRRHLTSRPTVMNDVSVPSDFPLIELNQFHATAPGKLFFGSTFSNVGNYIIILNEDGTPYFYRRFPSASHGAQHFECQPNGMLSFYSSIYDIIYIMNPHFEIVDSMTCTPNYNLDSHEFVYLENNHMLLIAEDPRIVDMSQFVEGGHNNASVRGEVIQEFDGDKNPIFEWSSWDHLEIEDANHENLTGSSINLVNFNSVAVDYDEHLILSVRNYDEIIKIHRQTGEILWRLGGKHSDFQFINDPEQFTYQHDARPVPGKPNHYTLFDNGNDKPDEYSRAVEYALNHDQMTAEKVWEYRPDIDRFANMMGSVQVLPNGNRLVDMSTFPPLWVAEVSAEGQLLSRLHVQETSSYRTRKYEFQGSAKIPYLIVEPYRERVTLIFNQFGDTNVASYRIYGGTSPQSTQLLATTEHPLYHLMNLDNDSQFYFRVTSVDQYGNESGFSNEERTMIDFYQPEENRVMNGDFNEGLRNWQFTKNNDISAYASVLKNTCRIRIRDESLLDDIQLVQQNIELVKDKLYIFEFDAYAEDTHEINVTIRNEELPNTEYFQFDNITLTTEMTNYQYTFSMEEVTDFYAQLIFNCGGNETSVYFDNISLIQQTPAIINDIPEIKDFQLLTNYPNPFNPETTIKYTLSQASDILLWVFNLQGEMIEELLNEKKTAGHHNIIWNASNHPTGTYLIRLQVDEHSRLLKCLLIK